MKNTKFICMMAALTCLGLGVSGCGKYDYDNDQIYTKHKNACEASIDNIEMRYSSSMSKGVGQFLYEDGVCECDDNRCSVGEVCYEKINGSIICVDYMCNDGERKCVSGKSSAYIYGCSELNWKLEKICGGENESGRCNADKTDCEKCDGNVGGCESECILVASNEFGHEYYEYKSCDKNGNPEKPKKCAFKCNDKIENGELGCVDCEKNECRDDKNLNVCDNGEFHVTTCPNGCSDGECKCNDGDVRCSGNVLENCANGKWGTQETCENGCSGGKCKVDCDDGDVKCDGNKVKICTNGEWEDNQECNYGCYDLKNGRAGCNCDGGDYLSLKCEVSETASLKDGLSKCIDGEWRIKGEDNKWDGTEINIMDNEAKCVCVKDDTIDSVSAPEDFRRMCKLCVNDKSGVGYKHLDKEKCSGVSCAGDSCGECLNGSKMCDKDVAGASVLKTCENGSWNSENCLECKQTDKTNAECVKFGEGCKNECIEDVAYVCIDNVSTRIGCSKGCELNNGVLLCAGCAESHKNGNDFRCVDCIDKSDCGDGYVCEENNCIQTIDSMCQSVSCINDGNGIGELQCSDNRTVKCDASCNGNVCGECLNRNTRCRDGKLQTCVEGKWGEGTPCSSLLVCKDNGDGKAKCVGGSGNVCTDGEKKCSYQYDTQNNTGTKIVVIRQNCIQGAWHGATASPNVLCDNSIVIDGESRCVSEINLNGQIVSGVIGYNYNNISGLSFEDCGDLECVEQGSQAECGGCKEDDKRCDGNKLQICKDGKWDGEECGNNKICINPNIKSGNKEAACYNLNDLRCIYRRKGIVNGTGQFEFQAVIQKSDAASYSASSDLYIYDDCTICNLTDSGGLTKEWGGNRMCANGTYEENNRINMNGVFEECKNGKIIYKACPDNQYCDGRSNSCVSASIDDATPDEPVEA